MVSERYTSSNSAPPDQERRTPHAKYPGSDRNRGQHATDFDGRRRSVLKLLGASAIPLSTAAGSAAASESDGDGSGYGMGGWGNGGYGTDDGSVRVSTHSPTDVADTAATLRGELTSLDDVDTVECYFEWREAGLESWTETRRQSLVSPETFDVRIDALNPETDYEFRAVAEADVIETGDVRSFTTDESDEPREPPSIDTFRVWEDSPPNPHAEIEIEWAVSSADGALDALEITVFDQSDGSVVDESTKALDGSSASGRETISVKKGAGDSYRIVLTVSDDDGTETSGERDLET